ncbi:MAG: hypothetical protein AAF959_27230 [Cyanobacteria bacterium P01_D01_bin.56]
MNSTSSVAASLPPEIRKDIGIQVLSHTVPISQLAQTHQVSRKFIYQQGDKAQQALDESFARLKAMTRFYFICLLLKAGYFN